MGGGGFIGNDGFTTSICCTLKKFFLTENSYHYLCTVVVINQYYMGYINLVLVCRYGVTTQQICNNKAIITHSNISLLMILLCAGSTREACRIGKCKQRD